MLFNSGIWLDLLWHKVISHETLGKIQGYHKDITQFRRCTPWIHYYLHFCLVIRYSFWLYFLGHAFKTLDFVSWWLKQTFQIAERCKVCSRLPNEKMLLCGLECVVVNNHLFFYENQIKRLCFVIVSKTVLLQSAFSYEGVDVPL